MHITFMLEELANTAHGHTIFHISTFAPAGSTTTVEVFWRERSVLEIPDREMNVSAAFHGDCRLELDLRVWLKLLFKLARVSLWILAKIVRVRIQWHQPRCLAKRMNHKAWSGDGQSQLAVLPQTPAKPLLLQALILPWFLTKPPSLQQACWQITSNSIPAMTSIYRNLITLQSKRMQFLQGRTMRLTCRIVSGQPYLLKQCEMLSYKQYRNYSKIQKCYAPFRLPYGCNIKIIHGRMAGLADLDVLMNCIYRIDIRGDGEVTRLGAGESYRPNHNRRSPPRADTFRSDRDRDRSPRRDRRTPPLSSDSYHPGGRDRSPRRRSRTPPYRARDRSPPRDMNWRGRARSPIRGGRTPLRARSPRRFSPRRDDDRRERPRSPRRDDR